MTYNDRLVHEMQPCLHMCHTVNAVMPAIYREAAPVAVKIVTDEALSALDHLKPGHQAAFHSSCMQSLLKTIDQIMSCTGYIYSIWLCMPFQALTTFDRWLQ